MGSISTLDLLFVSLSIGFLVLVGFLAFLIVKASQTLSSLSILLTDVEDIASDVKRAKDSTKFGLLRTIDFISAILGRGR